MADFTVVATSGLIVSDWLDPPSPSGAPSRLNARPGQAFKRYVGQLGVPVVLSAVVGGVAGPADAALGGRLFTASAIEAPAMPFVGISSPAGFSSVIQILAHQAGHYAIRIRRPDGGNEHVHLDIG